MSLRSIAPATGSPRLGNCRAGRLGILSPLCSVEVILGRRRNAFGVRRAGAAPGVLGVPGTPATQSASAGQGRLVWNRPADAPGSAPGNGTGAGFAFGQ